MSSRYYVVIVCFVNKMSMIGNLMILSPGALCVCRVVGVGVAEYDGS